MCVDIVWDCKMIAVIMSIILAVKRSLGCHVFVLLPCIGSGLCNPHQSHSLGSNIPFLSWECSRCTNYPPNKYFVCPWLASVMILKVVTFMITDVCLWPYAGVLWERLQTLILVHMLCWLNSNKSLSYSASCFILSAWRSLFFYAITKQSQLNYSIGRGVWWDA